jgi:2-dehydro-3-deoxygluconokinase
MSKVVTLGEVMIRLSTPGFKRFQQAMPGSLDVHFGGAEASVAGLIANWGGDAAFVTALPDTPLGHACVANLRSVGVDMGHTRLTAEGRMGVYFVEHGVNQRSGQVIYDRADSSFAITPPGDYDWDAIFSDATWLVVSGITPAISNNCSWVASVALEQARRHGVKIACDMNYRSKLWKWDSRLAPRDLAAKTMEEVVRQVDLLICGRDDAIGTLGISKDTPDDSLPAEISRRYQNVNHIAITQRESLSSTSQRIAASLYDTASGESFHAPGPGRFYEITDVVDRIGAGDAFVAALVFAMEDPALCSSSLAIQFANAAACLAHSIEGDLCYISRAEVELLIDQRGIGRIDR